MFQFIPITSSINTYFLGFDLGNCYYCNYHHRYYYQLYYSYSSSTKLQNYTFLTTDISSSKEGVILYVVFSTVNRISKPSSNSY